MKRVPNRTPLRSRVAQHTAGTGCPFAPRTGAPFRLWTRDAHRLAEERIPGSRSALTIVRAYSMHHMIARMVATHRADCSPSGASNPIRRRRKYCSCLPQSRPSCRCDRRVDSPAALASSVGSVHDDAAGEACDVAVRHGDLPSNAVPHPPRRFVHLACSAALVLAGHANPERAASAGPTPII